MIKINSVIVGTALAGLVATVPVTAALANSGGSSNPQDKITICHATGSSSNPYVKNAPDASGVISGHYPHQDSRDIIPPFTYNDNGTITNFPGQNWDATGQAIYNNDCNVPSTNGGGGGGGGGGVTPTPTDPGVTQSTVQSTQVTQVPVGSANSGGGGISDFSLTSLSRAW